MGAYLWAHKGEPRETDEQKYMILCRKLSTNPETYTLLNSSLLPPGGPARIAADVNGVPLFYHPPLMPIVLRGFYELCPEDSCEGANSKYIAVPILLHLLTLCLLWFYWGAARSQAQRAWPVVIYALSPLATMIATQVWIDSLLAFNMLLGMTLYHRACKQRSHAAFALAGLALGLAMVSKFTGVLLLPVLFFYHLHTQGKDKQSWARLGTASLTMALVALPWFVLFWQTYGMLLPDWIKPSAEMQRKFPFVAMMVERSPFFYLQVLGALMPVALFALGAGVKRLRDGDTAILAALALLTIAGFTYVGLTGGGYQERHILPIIPCLAIIAGRVIARLPLRVGWLPAALLLFGLWSVHGNLVKPGSAGSAEVNVFLPWSDGPIRIT